MQYQVQAVPLYISNSMMKGGLICSSAYQGEEYALGIEKGSLQTFTATIKTAEAGEKWGA